MSSNGPTNTGTNSDLLLPLGTNESTTRPSSDTNVEEWERRLLSGDEAIPDDFLHVTEPNRNGGTAASGQNSMLSTASSLTANATATITRPSGYQALPNKAETPDQEDAPSVEFSNPSNDKQPSPEEAAPLPQKDKRPMTTEEKDHAMALALQRQLQLEDEEQAAAARAGVAMGGGVPYMTIWGG